MSVWDSIGVQGKLLTWGRGMGIQIRYILVGREPVLLFLWKFFDTLYFVSGPNHACTL